uniref:Gypsy retrotransposon integrase-like protein 1 n=1 Tax=Gasterosteus aculeatus aculeatus TaxID=481459 RepID=A0AAQ4Q9F2_GASAC
MEVGQTVRVAGPPAPSPGLGATYGVPVRIQGGIHQAMVDSGCTQSMIHQRLVRPGALVEASRVSIKCVHGDIHDYPVVPIEIRFGSKKHRVRVAVSSRLTHPLILGTDLSGFHKLAGQCAGVRSRPIGTCRVCAALDGDARLSDAADGEGESAGPPMGTLPTPELRSMEDFPLEQSRDDTLRFAFDQVIQIDGQVVRPDAALSYPHFSLIRDRLYRVSRDTQTGQEITQLLVPKSRRETVFQATHYNPMAGHLGSDKTLDRIVARFYWPGIWADVRRWCASCPQCQLVNQPAIPKAPLRPLPLMELPFERLGMDLIGPFHRSARGYRFVLVLVDYATRYPEAVPLRSISAKSVAQELFQVISRVRIPKEILTDQGTSFMSRTLRELYELLGVKSVRTSVYHPQTDGLVERLNKTLKSMIRKFIHDDERNWDKWLDPLLFAVREVPQASTGFSPFELLFGRRPRGVLDLLKEHWEEGPSLSKNEIQYVLDLRAKLHTLGELSRENLLQAQERQQRLYNRGARLRQFTPGEKVLVFLLPPQNYSPSGKGPLWSHGR